MLFTVTTIILFEEIYGQYRSPQLPIVLLANAPWILFPIFIAYRMGRSPQPFTRTALAGEHLGVAQPAAQLDPHQA